MDRLHEVFGDSLAIIRYHGWWPFSGDPFWLANTAESQDRIYYLYDHQQFPNDGLYAPHFFVDMIFDADAEPSTYENKVRQALAVPSLIAMDVDLDLDFATRQLTVTCSGQAEAAIADALHLRCALIESDLVLPSSNFPYDQVMRDMFPSSAGIPIDLATTQTFEAEATATLNPAWELHNLEVVVFVQEDAEGEIFQTVKVGMPSDLPWFKLVSFGATETGTAGDGDGVINPGEDGTIALAIRTDPAWGAVEDTGIVGGIALA